MATPVCAESNVNTAARSSTPRRATANNETAKVNPPGYKLLTEFFNDNGYLDNYENRALKILNGFVEKYPFFITARGWNIMMLSQT